MEHLLFQHRKYLLKRFIISIQLFVDLFDFLLRRFDASTDFTEFNLTLVSFIKVEDLLESIDLIKLRFKSCNKSGFIVFCPSLAI